MRDPPEAEPDRPHVVVVDDEPAMRDILVILLEAAGYAVTTASDGEEAMTVICGAPPDAVLTDVRMPRLDGPSLVACLAERLADGLPPIIVTTADDRLAKRLEGDPQVFAVLQKPLDTKQVARVVGAAVASGRGRA